MNEIKIHIKVVEILCHMTWLPSGKISLVKYVYYKNNISFTYYNNIRILLWDINLFKAQSPIRFI